MRKLLVVYSLLVWSGVATACDFCNCYLGINPHYKKNSIGLRATSSNYNGSHMESTELEKYNLTTRDFEENRSTYEIQAQYYPVQKLQMQLFIPYILNSETMSDNAYRSFTTVPLSTARISHADHTALQTEQTAVEKSSKISGMGDPLFLAKFQVFNSNGWDSTALQQRMLLGAGVKFPLGKSHFDATIDPLEKSHQPGTGSWDVLPNLTYLAKYKAIGVNINLSYMITTEDKHGFKNSNRWNANASVYREFMKGKISIYPSLGVYFEQAGMTNYQGSNLEKSGGNLILAHSGLDFYYRKISLSTAFHLPTLQKLNGTQPHMNYRFIVGLSYVINS